ncbi:MAG: hypothetical protein ACOCQD_03970 [archaeon]
MMSKTFYVSSIIFVDEDENTYNAEDVQGLFENLVVDLEIEEDSDVWEIEHAIKIELDEYLVNIGRSDYRVYEFVYAEE